MVEAEPQRTYRVVFFDLDGTLLPMEMEDFLGEYYKKLGTKVAKAGYDPDAFIHALNRGVRSMASHTDPITNDQAYFQSFFSLVDDHALDWMDLYNDFYCNDFGTIGEGVKPNPAARQAVEILKAKGYPLVLATMPLFPREAIIWRLKWADVPIDAFARITDYENSRSAKPRRSYFAESMLACGVKPDEVLMVGNNTVEDHAISSLGADVYLVTDYLIDDVNRGLETIKHGSLEDFTRWAATLPPCEDPAGPIDDGPQDPEAIQQFLDTYAADAPAEEKLVHNYEASEKSR